MTWNIKGYQPSLTTHDLATTRACWKVADPTVGMCCIGTACMAWQDVDVWLALARDKKTGEQEMVDVRFMQEDLDYYEKLGEPAQAGFCGALLVRP